MYPALPCMATPMELKAKLCFSRRHNCSQNDMNGVLTLLLLQISMIGSHITSDLLASLPVVIFNGEIF